MTSLYHLTAEFKMLEQLFEQEGTGDIERFKQITDLLQNKTDDVVYYRNSLEDFRDAVEKRKLEIEEALTAIESKISKLDNYVRASMIELGTSKLTGKINSISMHKPRTRVEITDKDQVPMEFLETKTSVIPKLTEIKQAIEAGEQVAGAQIVEGKRTLKFKPGL